MMQWVVNKLQMTSKKKASLKNFISSEIKLPNSLALSIIFLLAVTTRFYKIETPAWVCWDEAHFGKYANYYINSSFYFDVHPPLGKMLFAFVGAVNNYNGNFSFKETGLDYSHNFYVPMRQLAAFFGVLTILFIYGMTYEITTNVSASVLSALLVICDTGSLTLSRFILLDSPLICCMCGTMYFYLKYRNLLNKKDALDGCEFLVAAGYCMAFTMSIKMVGLFLFITIGIITAIDLFCLVIDHTIPWTQVYKFIETRLLALIIVPFVIYYTLFICHMLTVSFSGPGDGFFSPQFQLTLYDNNVDKNFRNISRYVTNKSMVVLKGCETKSNYLHSHTHVYPKEHGPEQQQVTGYSFIDLNSYWYITKVSGSAGEYIADGDTILLTHNATQRNLHSHNEKAPINTKVYQVSGYGGNHTYDSNDEWVVKILKNPIDKRIGPVSTRISLIHKNMKCDLMFSGDKLPKWGFEQEESICNNNRGHPKRCWMFVYNQSPLEEVEKVDITDSIRLSWVDKILEYQNLMLTVNNNLVPKGYEMTSRPWMWPINYKGIWFSGKSEHRVYLLGNPVLWWSCLLIVVNYPIIFLVLTIYSLRYPKDPLTSSWNNCHIRKCWPVYLLWAINYFPYFLMGRVLYYHHYFPSYHLSCVLAGVVINFLIREVIDNMKESSQPNSTKNSFSILHILLIVGIGFSFYCFSFLSYGMTGNISAKVPNNSSYSAYRWLNSWEF